MSNEQGYQGWSNYETWNVALWFSNDQGLYILQQEWLEQAKEEGNPTRWLDKQLDNWLDDWVSEMNLTGMASDLMNAAVQAANTREIAENWLLD